MSAKGAARNQKIDIVLPEGTVSLYASPRILHALEAVTGDMNIFQGVKLKQVLEAVYIQGRKDGAREAFEKQQEAFASVMNQIPHRNPGRQRVAKKAAKKASRPSAKKAARKRTRL